MCRMTLPKGNVIRLACNLCKLQTQTSKVHPIKHRRYTQQMQLAFKKMQGAGNQILVIDQRGADPVSPTEDILKSLCNTELGPGFDQLMWLGPPHSTTAIASYRVFNNDGSEVEQCGNGVRCVAVMLAKENDQQTEFMLESPAGLIAARIVAENRASVNMGTPVFDTELTELDVAGSLLDVTVLSMGNPHCVLEVADVSTVDVAGMGPAIEHHERFPNR